MTLKGKRVLVCGAGGFIGGHMVRNLLSSGVAFVRAVDIKPKTEWHEVLAEAENLVLDLSEKRNCLNAVDDSIRGTRLITESNVREPLNRGSSELVTIDQLVTLVEGLAGVPLKRRYNLLAPWGVNGRNSGNTRVQQRLGWSPSISLFDGMARTYHWIEREMNQSSRLPHHAGVLERYATA
jgi:nucleoside-diphosphate-sugar epimerase